MSYIDAFYRTYENSKTIENPQARSSEPGIKLVDDNWDVQSKRLVNVNPGVEVGDVVITDQALVRDGNSFKVGSKKYEFMEVDKQAWGGKKRKISDLVAGESDTDAATVGQIMRVNKNTWNGKKLKISNVVPGTAKDDVAVYSQIPKDYLTSKDGKWDGKNKIISNVSKGVKPNDVATFNQIPKDYLSSKDGKWDGKNKIISNVAKGAKSNDVAIFSQIPNDYLSSKDGNWEGKNKIISNVAKGVKPNDVATFSQIPKDNLSLKDGKWNGDNKIIENVAAGTKANDVLTYDQALKAGPDDDFFTTDNKRYKFMKQKTEQWKHLNLENQLVDVHHFWDANKMLIRNGLKAMVDTDLCRLDQVSPPSVDCA